MNPGNAPRITILNRLFWPKRFGGLERVLWQYANGLADQGASIHVLTESIEGSPDQEQARDGVTVQRHAPVVFGRLWRVAEWVQARWWMRALRHAPRTDIIWANEPTAACAAIRMGLGAKLVYRPVFCYAGLTHAADTEPAMAPLRRSLLARRMDRYACKHAAILVDESHNLRQQQSRFYGRRSNTLVIPNPAQAPPTMAPQRGRFGLSSQHFVIGFVGRPGDPCKDLPFLISAIKQQRLPDHTRLLIVGGGDGFDQAQRWVKEAGLSPHTLWTGDLVDPAPAFATMDALVLPSRFETFGNVIAEAHAHGIPALARAADFDSTPPVYTASAELIDDGVTGFVIDPHDPADLGQRLNLLAANPSLAADMGATARTRSASYTWFDAAERYLQAMGLKASGEFSTRWAA